MTELLRIVIPVIGIAILATLLVVLHYHCSNCGFLEAYATAPDRL